MDPKFFYKSNDVTRIAFELLDNPMIEELTCSICLEIFNKPTQTECNHRFCKGCIDSYFGTDLVKNCPLCRTFIHKSQLKHSAFAESIISKLKVKCSEKSCIDIFIINDIKNNDCNFVTRECKFNCGKKIIKKNIHEHEDGCLETLVQCKFGCEEMIKQKEIENHYDVFGKIHAEKMYKKINEKIFINIPNVSQTLIDIRNIKIEIENNNKKRRSNKWNDIQESNLHNIITKILVKIWKGKEIPENIIEKSIEEGVSFLLNNFYLEDRHDKFDLQNKYGKLVNSCFRRYKNILMCEARCEAYKIPYDKELATKLIRKS